MIRLILVTAAIYFLGTGFCAGGVLLYADLETDADQCSVSMSPTVNAPSAPEKRVTRSFKENFGGELGGTTSPSQTTVATALVFNPKIEFSPPVIDTLTLFSTLQPMTPYQDGPIKPPRHCS